MSIKNSSGNCHCVVSSLIWTGSLVAGAATVWGLMQVRDRFEITLCVGYSTVCLV
jgi:hypothetical protein